MRNKISVVILIGMILLLVNGSVKAEQSTESETKRVTLHVDGMTCRSCVPKMRKALLSVPGVKQADVSYDDAQAVVEYVSGKVTDDQIIKTIEDQSGFFYTYTAKVVPPTE